MATITADIQHENDSNLSDRQLPEVDYIIEYLRSAKKANRSPAEQDVEGALNDLFTLYKVGAEAVRFRVVNQLFDYGDCVSLAFDALRDDPSTLVRHEAAFALGQVKSNASSRLLAEVGLNDQSYLVRHEAAMGLVDTDYKPALPALEKRLSDSNPEVVASCQVAIASIKHRLKSQRLTDPQEDNETMPKESEFRDRFHKPKAGHPPYYMDDISVLFIDLVDFSSRRIGKEMAHLVRDLQDIIFTTMNSDYYWDETHPDKPNKIIVIPTGDGYAIAFHPTVDRRAILKHVDELYKELCFDKKLKIRYGISRGPHFLFVDLNSILNLIGEGIIRAQRAMMLSSPGQILCTAEFAEGIEREIEGRLEPIEGEWQIKEERPFRIFNYRNRKVGNDVEPNEDYRLN